MVDRGGRPVAVVCGAGSGIGFQTALELVRQGLHVAAWDRDGTGLARLEEAARVGTGLVESYRVDITDPEAVADASARVRDPVRYLVNAAGVQTYGNLFDTPLDLWQATLASNLTGQFLSAQHIGSRIRDAGGGAIVNLSSVQALHAHSDVLAYATAKGAVISMTRALAVDLAPYRIRVNAVAPGSVDTPMLREAARRIDSTAVDRVMESWSAAQPLGRLGTADDIARTVRFLLMEAEYMTGAVVVVDGGLTVRLP